MGESRRTYVAVSSFYIEIEDGLAHYFDYDPPRKHLVQVTRLRVDADGMLGGSRTYHSRDVEWLRGGS